MFELTNREWGSVILTGLVVGGLMLWAPTRRAILHASVDVLRALAKPKVLILLAIYALYIVVVLLLASAIGAWSLNMLKDTLIIVVSVGLPMFFSINKIKDGTAFVRDVIRDLLGVSALVVAYLGLASLPIWAEVLLQGSLGFLVILRAFAPHVAQGKALIRPLDVLTGAVVIGLFVLTTVQVVSNWASLPWVEIRDSFVFSVWFPLALVPFIYILTLYAAYETVTTMLSLFINHRRPKRGVVAALVIGTQFRTAYATRVTGAWRGKLAHADSFRAGLTVMRDFRAGLKAQGLQYRSDQSKLALNAGATGTDENGLQLDRREYAATKKALAELRCMELGWHTNQLGRYRGDLVNFLSDVNTKGLPDDHGIHEVSRSDGRSWRAWRVTPSGYVFAVGGTGDTSAEWQYDGTVPPSGFPSERGGWRNVSREPGSNEWLAHEPMMLPPE